ncbi:MAG: DUF6089 family protein [Bacteroidota bacterium]
MKRLFLIAFSLCALVIIQSADAQQNKYKRRKKTNKKISKYRGSTTGFGRFSPYWFVGVNANAANYFGDLAPVSRAASTDISFTRPGFGIHGGYKFQHSLAVRGSFDWYRIRGDDFSADPGEQPGAARYGRNLSFRNDIKEFRLGLEIYLLPNYGNVNSRLPLNAYLFLGGAVFLHDPQGLVPDADYQTALDGSVSVPKAGEWVRLRPLGTEGQNQGRGESYSRVSYSIPVALGGKLRLPGLPLDVGLEFGIRYLFTDFIDDVSGDYVDLASFDADGDGNYSQQELLARIMSDRSTVPVSSTGDTRDQSALGNIVQSPSSGFFINGSNGTGLDGSVRGNPDDNDFIFVTQLKLTYLIGQKYRRRAKFR